MVKLSEYRVKYANSYSHVSIMSHVSHVKDNLHPSTEFIQ